jgi:hypothetical protein
MMQHDIFFAFNEKNKRLLCAYLRAKTGYLNTSEVGGNILVFITLLCLSCH